MKIKEKFLSFSVSKKILIGTIATSFVTLALFSIVGVYRDRLNFSREKLEHLASVASIVASNSEAALGFSDPFTAEEYLQSLKSENDITHAAIFDAEQSLFARYLRDRSKAPPAFPDFVGGELSDGLLSFVKEIRIEGELLGTLLIEADSSSLQQRFRQSILFAVLLLAAGTLVAALIGVSIQKYITGPLSALESIARKVSKKRDYSVRATHYYDDEIGSLAESFNFMMESIQDQDRAIRDSNKNLEQQVAARTTELRSAMEKAQAASKAKSEFLSTISHELRTPMNAIVGISSLLDDPVTEEERKSYVKIIHSSSDALLSLMGVF